MLLDSKKVFACKFIPRAARFNGDGSGGHFTNVFVKNFGTLWDKEMLERKFSKFGNITSCAIMEDESGKSKGFGFVAFEKAEDAERAVSEMNGAEVEPGSEKKIAVCRAQTKSERLRELKRNYDTTMQKYSLGNLYVKHLNESVDDAQLREMFEKYGKVSSAKVSLRVVSIRGAFRLCGMKADARRDSASCVSSRQTTLIRHKRKCTASS